MIDTHAHLTIEYYDNLAEVILKNSLELKLIINSATNDVDSKEVIEIANKYENIYASVGIHPTEKGDVAVINDLAINKKVIAIGEIGLDYYHKPYDKLAQREKFVAQLNIAQLLKKPVIIHSRDATEDVLEILEKYPDVKGVVHCFSGSVETANLYKKLGYKLGIGGVLTFQNSPLVEVVKELALEDIVVETDAPFLSPAPYRGKINYPYNVNLIYKKIAEIKDVSVEEVVSKVEANVLAIFDF